MFPFSLLPSLLKYSILEFVNVNDSLKLLQVNQELRQRVQIRGPFPKIINRFIFQKIDSEEKVRLSIQDQSLEFVRFSFYEAPRKDSLFSIIQIIPLLRLINRIPSCQAITLNLQERTEERYNLVNLSRVRHVLNFNWFLVNDTNFIEHLEKFDTKVHNLFGIHFCEDEEIDDLDRILSWIDVNVIPYSRGLFLTNPHPSCWSPFYASPRLELILICLHKVEDFRFIVHKFMEEGLPSLNPNIQLMIEMAITQHSEYMGHAGQYLFNRIAEIIYEKIKVSHVWSDRERKQLHQAFGIDLLKRFDFDYINTNVRLTNPRRRPRFDLEAEIKKESIWKLENNGRIFMCMETLHEDYPLAYTVRFSIKYYDQNLIVCQ